MFFMSEEITLFDKYGGVPTIRLIIKAFYKEVLKRSYFKRFFAKVDMERLIEHQVEFVAFAMGKPKSHYPDSFLARGHRGLKITNSQFDEITLILEKILSNFQVERKDISTILDTIARKRHLVVNVE